MLDLGALLRVPFVETEMGFDVSPDGKKVAFSWNPGGRWEIFELGLDGLSSPRQLSHGPGAKFHPRYAPDGRRLAFVTDFDGSENYHLFLYDFGRDRQSDLTPGIDCALQAFFAWSPDGRQIAYLSDASGQFDTYVMTVNGGAGDPLVLDAGHPGWKVRWSPDGRWLAVTAEASGVDFNTYIVPARGGDPVCLSVDGRPINAKDACWSPDSRRLAFSSDVRGQFDVGIYELGRKSITWLTSGEGQKQYPAWSPDGRRLAVALSKDETSQIYLLDLLTGEASRFTRGGALDTEPVFSPDGQWLYFTSDRGGSPQIYRASLATGVATRITFEGSYNVSPALSPDGHTLAFVHRRDGRFHIAAMDLNSRQMQVLTDTVHDESPSFAANGRLLLYATLVNDRGVLATVSVDGKVKQRLSQSGDLREPAWGP